MKLVLLRHGNTFESNQTPYQVGLKTDLALTQKGHMQAQAFADFWQACQHSITAIYCGSLQRQRQTAAILAAAFPNALCEQTLALNEIDYGDWEGLTAEEIDSQWPQEHQQWQHQAFWPQVFRSSMTAHVAQLQAFVDHLKRYKQNDTVVAVTSNGIIRLFLNLIPKLWSELQTSQSFNDFKVKTGHYCEIEMLNDELIIQQWNLNPVTLSSSLAPQ